MSNAEWLAQSTTSTAASTVYPPEIEALASVADERRAEYQAFMSGPWNDARAALAACENDDWDQRSRNPTLPTPSATTMAATARLQVLTEYRDELDRDFVAANSAWISVCQVWNRRQAIAEYEAGQVAQAAAVHEAEAERRRLVVDEIRTSSGAVQRGRRLLGMQGGR